MTKHTHPRESPAARGVTRQRRLGPFSAAHAVVTAVILALVTIVAFEAMALSAIMPAIATDLDAGGSYGLAFSALLTAQLVGIVVAGVWTERHGPVPGMMAGQLLLAGGSVLCALAPNFAIFLTGRVIAGLGGGILLVLLYVVVGRSFDEHIRPRVFTLISAAWIVPALVGGPVAAWITQHLGWRAVFWVLIPPILLTSVVITAQARSRRGDLAPPATSPRDHRAHQQALRAGVIVAVSAGVMQFGSTHLSPPGNGAILASVAGLVGVAIFAPRLVPPGTWRCAHGLPSVLAGRALATASFFGGLTYAPLFLVRERHLGLAHAGLLVSAGSLGWSLGSFIQGLSAFNGRRERLVVIGGVLLSLSLGALALIAAVDLPTWLFIPVFVLGGTGMGLCVASQSVLALELVDTHEHGLVSSGLMLSDVLGSVIGIALASAVFAAGHGSQPTGATRYVVIWAGCALVAAGIIVAGLRIGKDPATGRRTSVGA
ncbi:MAG: MFS transporter [Nostocoides sp.]